MVDSASIYGIGLMCQRGNKIPEYPNILVIITDQQSASMMSCTSNPWLKTPGHGCHSLGLVCVLPALTRRIRFVFLRGFPYKQGGSRRKSE